jgi:hypothetical protein
MPIAVVAIGGNSLVKPAISLPRFFPTRDFFRRENTGL